MGDFKPSQALYASLPVKIQRGIENHRLTDRLTDGFTPVKELKPLFSLERRRYAGIITDIAFDYFLIKHWDQTKDPNLKDFTQSCYAGFKQCEKWMPERMLYVTQQMCNHDWLSSYQTLDGIGKSIDMVGKRLRFTNTLQGGIEEVIAHYDEIESVFLELHQFLTYQIQLANIELRHS